jgi:hypothetical protein
MIKRYKKYYLPILLSLIFVSFCGLVYFVNLQLGKPKEDFVASLPFVGILTPDPETDGWKLYKAPKLIDMTYSVKYPPTWFKTTNNPGHSSLVPDSVFSPKRIPNVYLRSSPCFSVDAGIYGTE